MERGVEFYIMLAVMAVGVVTWLYKKSRKVYTTVRKLHRSFKEICLHPHSKLNDEQCRQLAIGAMYAAQQGAWQNSMETGIKSLLPEMLGKWWGINSAKEAYDQLNYLCEKGFRHYWPTVLEAFDLNDPQQQEALFQQRMTSQEEYDKITAQFENLRETYEELISYGVIVSKEDLARYGVTGWDAGRVCFLARACCEMGYISEAEAWEYIGKADVWVHEACGSWQELAMSYIIGRSLWGGKRAYNSAMKHTADVLLSNPQSPWIRYRW